MHTVNQREIAEVANRLSKEMQAREQSNIHVKQMILGNYSRINYQSIISVLSVLYLCCVWRFNIYAAKEREITHRL